MKRYLTGIDWIVHSIDYSSKAQSGIGNHSELVLELERSPGQIPLEDLLSSFIKKFPVLNGYPCRALNLCPYWKILPPKKSLPGWVRMVHLGEGPQYLEALIKQVSLPFTSKREHLIFTIIETPARSFLGMTFDHRILDAKGAEAFLNLFQQFYDHKATPQVSVACPAHLNGWLKKFLDGRKINRFLLQLTKDTPRTLPFNQAQEPAKFKVIHFNQEQSQRLLNAAYSRAGYLMFMPYALARTIQIMHEVFQENNSAGSAYFIPVPIDMRSREEAQKEALFNHFSFFIFKIGVDKIANLDQLLAEIKTQMYEQVKNKIPDAIVNGSFLMRIASLPVAGFFMRLMSKKNFASFSFCYLNNVCQPAKLMETKIKNIFHLPRTPKPPGIGIYFNQFEDRINITLSYFDGLLKPEQLTRITKGLEALGNEIQKN